MRSKRRAADDFELGSEVQSPRHSAITIAKGTLSSEKDSVLLDKCYDNPSDAINPNPNDEDNATSLLLDQIIVCVQELKRQKEN